MPRPIGHNKILKRLHKGVPQVSLFLGEESVGRWTTAEYVLKAMDIQNGDYLRIKHLNEERARDVSTFLKNAPFGAQRAVLIYLGEASLKAQNILLPTLEALPKTSRVIMVGGLYDALPALKSRGEVFHFGLLKKKDVQEILMSRGFNEANAQHLAELSGGRMSQALQLASAPGNDTTILVKAAVRAVKDRDAKTLDSLASRWSEAHSELLSAYCREAITQRLYVFTEADVEYMGRSLALQILTALKTTVRPRLVVHAQLMGVLRGEK